MKLLKRFQLNNKITLEQLKKEVLLDPSIPLIINLDRTITVVDIFQAQLFHYLFKKPWKLFWILRTALIFGVPTLKEQIYLKSELKIDLFKINPILLETISDLKNSKIEISSKYCRGVINEIANRINSYAEISFSEDARHLVGKKKAQYLSSKYGEGGYFYIGNSYRDKIIGRKSAGFASVDFSGDTSKKTIRRKTIEFFKNITSLLRVKHWVKNSLVFVPFIASHNIFYDFGSSIKVLLLFISLSITASSTYILNDIFDFANDAEHPWKSRRPLSAGAITFPTALFTFTIFFLAGIYIASKIGGIGVALVVLYTALTLLYMLLLKRILLLDIVFLSMLYVFRVIAGGLVISINVTSWLILFSYFIFFTLATIKRYTELAKLEVNESVTLPGRAYAGKDKPVLGMISVSTGLATIMTYSLYITSETINEMYLHPQILLLGVPTLLYWITNLILMGMRLEIDLDPIDWALKDLKSRVSLLIFALIFLGALAPWS